jgi:hypothetical protein
MIYNPKGFHRNKSYVCGTLLSARPILSHITAYHKKPIYSFKALQKNLRKKPEKKIQIRLQDYVFSISLHPQNETNTFLKIFN